MLPFAELKHKADFLFTMFLNVTPNDAIAPANKSQNYLLGNDTSLLDIQSVSEFYLHKN